MLRVLDATKESSQELPLDEFLERCVEYFEDGCVIDQPFQSRLRKVSFAATWQAIAAPVSAIRRSRPGRSTGRRAQAGPRLYSFNADARFQRLRRLMEDEWVPQLTSLLNIPLRDLPMIWDADFMLGPPNPDGTDSYVLGEINVSSVFPIPDEAPAEIARRVADRLRSKF